MRNSTRAAQVASAALGVAIAISAGAIVLFSISAQQPTKTTEFFLLDANGMTSNYPIRLQVGQPGNVQFVVRNRELGSISYTARIDLVGIQVLQNQTTGRNETLEKNRTTLSIFNRTLFDGEEWTQPYQFAISSVGTWQVQFLLFRLDTGPNPYRQVRLGVDVV